MFDAANDRSHNPLVPRGPPRAGAMAAYLGYWGIRCSFMVVWATEDLVGIQASLEIAVRGKKTKGEREAVRRFPLAFLFANNIT